MKKKEIETESNPSRCLYTLDRSSQYVYNTFWGFCDGAFFLAGLRAPPPYTTFPFAAATTIHR
jgi:hypothetical protein